MVQWLRKPTAGWGSGSVVERLLPKKKKKKTEEGRSKV